MATEVGVGYVRLIPTARGFAAAASEALGAPMRQAAQQVGQEAGQTLGEALADGMQSAGRTLTAAVTAPLAGIGILAIRTAGSFEAAMNGIRAVTGATGADFDSLRDKARELGSITAYSATEAANAMEFLGMAGWDTEQILSGIPDVLNLAAAGGLELASAADIASNIMSGFNIHASEMGRVSDVLAKTAASANVDVGMLGESMKYTAPLAAAAGWSLEEAAAATGILGDAGIQGSMAGTGLNSILATLADTSSTGGQRLAEFGVAAHDANGEIRPLTGVLADLAEQGADVADVISIFGLEAGPKLQALLGRGSEGLQELITDLENSSGAAQEMADIRMEGLEGQLKALGSAWEGLQLALIMDTGILDWITGLVTRITEFTQRLGQLNPEILKWAVGAAAVAAATGPLLWIAGQLAGALVSLAAAGPLLARAVGLVSAAFGLLLSPVGLVIAALAAVAAGLVYAYQRSETFRDIVSGAAGAVADAFGPVLGVISDVREAFAEGGLGAAIATAVDGFREIGPQLLTAFQGAFASLVAFIGANGPQIVDTLLALRAAVFDGAIELFGGIVAALPVIIPQVITALTGMILQLVGALTTALPLIVDGAVTLLNGIVQAVPIVLPAMIQGIIGILTAVLDALITALPLLLEAGIALVLALADGLVEALPVLIEFVGGHLIPTLIEAIAELLPLIIEAGVDLVLALMEGLADAQPQLMGAIAAMVPVIVATLIRLLPQLIEAGVRILGALGAGVVRALPQLLRMAADLIPQIVRTLVRLFPQITTAGMQLLGSLVLGIGRAVPQLPRTIVVSVIPAIVRALMGAGGSLISIGWDLMRSLATGIRDGATNLVRGAANWVTSMLPSWKGPRSLDLRLLTPAGQLVMTGFERGITDSIPSLRRTLAGVSASIPAMVDASVALPSAALSTPGAGAVPASRQLVLAPSGSAASKALMRLLQESLRNDYGGDITRLNTRK